MRELEEIMARLTAYISRTEEEAREQLGFNELTVTQMNYLETISKLQQPTLTALAGYLKLTKPTVTVLVERLIEKQLVFKVKSDTDRRSTHLHLTEKGILINKMHIYAHRQIAAEIVKKIDSRETVELIRLLDKILI